MAVRMPSPVSSLCIGLQHYKVLVTTHFVRVPSRSVSILAGLVVGMLLAV